MRLWLTVFIFLATACTTLPKPVAENAKPKSYVVYHKKQFLRPAAESLSHPTILGLVKVYGSDKMQPMKLVNGFTVKTDKPPVLAESDDWAVQEEVEYKTLETLYRLTPVQCNTPAPNPTPTPTPVPTPVPQPTPTPTPTPSPVGSKSWGVTRVHAIEAQGIVDTSGVKVCIVDTGIDLQHPNKGNVIGSIGFAGAVQDGAGHGTHTAGTVGGTGGVGVSRAQLLICKGLSDAGSGSSSGLAQCLTWCGQQGAQIVSNSWGSSQSDPFINQAISALTAKGIYVFVAAGNDSGPVNWPAKLAGSNPNVFAVAASDKNDQITFFSSRGPEIRYISPGAAVISNWSSTASETCPSSPGSGLCALDGTSMATPHAAAICAFGIAKGKKPCIVSSGTVSNYPFADALATAK